MATRRLGCVCVSLAVLFSQVILTLECGVTTHTEIGERAIHHFADENSKFTYQKLIRKHEDAFQAGNPYPDAYYPSVCSGGKYHDIAEDSHWSEFINATLNYIQNKRPKQWDEATEKLVVFMLGFVSHQVADISWHNLGIHQGFLQTMANINFHNQFDVAHTAGDLGGDVLNMFEMNLDYVNTLSDWYIPTDDLYNIYMDMYGKERMPKTVIEECTAILYLARLGEHIALKEVYVESAKKAPFLLDQLSDYFIGGMDDMAAWTQVIWRNVLHMLEHGHSGCYVPHNPLFITCNKTSTTKETAKLKSAKESGIPMRLLDHGLTKDDIVVERVHRGVRFRASEKLKDYIRQHREKYLSINELRKMNKLDDKQVKPDSVLTVPESYAKFGWALSVGDLNADGKEDLAIGAPGHGSEFASQDGRVFIIYGTNDRLPIGATQDINSVANVTMAGPQRAQSRFGSSIAVLDLNLDGVNDIAVGAPNYGSMVTPLKYNGMAYIYYGSREDRYRFSRVNMTISCKDTFCTNGWTLSVGDLNGDSHPDLIVGSPWAPAGGEQRGFVGAVFASKKYRGETTLSVDKLDWIRKGEQDYGWFGSGVSVKEHPTGQKLLINQPTYRKCEVPSCSYNPNDTQSVGQFNMFSLPAGNAGPMSLTGSHRFQSFGAGFDIGRPYPGSGPLLAVSAAREDVKGKVMGFDTEFSQTGAVHLYNISELTLPLHQVATLPGDRRYGRFGAKVKFADLNRDGLDDLIVTAPFRTEDVTEELYGAEEGRVYVYMGGDTFPKGDNSFYNCGPSIIEPCPGEKASYELIYGEEKARFGSNIAVLRTNNTVHLVVTAIHGNSQNGRLSGVVTLFKFQHSKS